MLNYEKSKTIYISTGLEISLYLCEIYYKYHIRGHGYRSWCVAFSNNIIDKLTMRPFGFDINMDEVKCIQTLLHQCIELGEVTKDREDLHNTLTRAFNMLEYGLTDKSDNPPKLYFTLPTNVIRICVQSCLYMKDNGVDGYNDLVGKIRTNFRGFFISKDEILDILNAIDAYKASETPASIEVVSIYNFDEVKAILSLLNYKAER